MDGGEDMSSTTTKSLCEQQWTIARGDDGSQSFSDGSKTVVTQSNNSEWVVTDSGVNVRIGQHGIILSISAYDGRVIFNGSKLTSINVLLEQLRTDERPRIYKTVGGSRIYEFREGIKISKNTDGSMVLATASQRILEDNKGNVTLVDQSGVRLDRRKDGSCTIVSQVGTKIEVDNSGRWLVRSNLGNELEEGKATYDSRS